MGKLYGTIDKVGWFTFGYFVGTVITVLVVFLLQ